MVEYPSDWKVVPLSRVGNVAMCRRVLKSQTGPTGDVPFFKIGTFGLGVPDAYISRSLFEALKKTYSYPEIGSVLVSAAGTIGRTVVYSGKEAYFQDSNIVWINNDESEVLNSYLYWWYKVIDWQTENGGTVARLYNKNFESSKIAVPPLPEQKRIAKVLDDVDRLIENLGKRIAKKRLIKKGIAQELLTGKRRLPGFEGEWKTVKLGEVCSITTGHKDVNVSREQGQYPFFSCSKKVYRADTYTFDGEAIMVAGNGDVGNLHYFNGKFEAYQRTYVLMGFKENIGFVWQCLDANLMTMLSEGKVGSSMPYIVLEQLAGFKFPLPPFVEQRAIAKVLSDMDAEIANLEARQAKLKLVKKGMLQDLLTGKVRLKG